MDGEFSSVSTPDVVSEITTLAGHLNVANARFLALIADWNSTGKQITPATAVSRCTGEALDQGLAISSLMAKGSKNVPAGTSL